MGKNGWRELVANPAALDTALAHTAISPSVEVDWELAIAAHRLITARRFDDALRVYDAIVARPNLELTAYCNALWVVQRDNTGHPVEPARARRYLAAGLPHAPMNPPIFLNASGVLMELGETEAALDALLHAARYGVDLHEALSSPLFAPLHSRDAWHELERLSRPLAWEEPDAAAASRSVSAAEQVSRLLALATHDDPRVAHRAMRQLVWWVDEDGDDGHGWRATGPLLAWYQAVGAEISGRVDAARFGERISADLDGPFAHEAAHTLSIVVRCHFPAVSQVFSLVGAARLALAVRDGDEQVRAWVLDALSCIRPATDGEVLRRCGLEPARHFVERLARGPSLSDVSRVTLDELRDALTVLENLGELVALEGSFRALAAGARGENWDKSVRATLLRLAERGPR